MELAGSFPDTVGHSGGLILFALQLYFSKWILLANFGSILQGAHLLRSLYMVD